MKSLTRVFAVTTLLAVPALAFAQSNNSVTRGDANNQLMQVEQSNSGRNAFVDSNASYPVGAQTVSGIVAAQTVAGANSYGGAADGNSGYGAKTPSVSTGAWHSMYDRS